MPLNFSTWMQRLRHFLARVMLRLRPGRRMFFALALDPLVLETLLRHPRLRVRLKQNAAVQTAHLELILHKEISRTLFENTAVIERLRQEQAWVMQLLDDPQLLQWLPKQQNWLYSLVNTPEALGRLRKYHEWLDMLLDDDGVRLRLVGKTAWVSRFLQQPQLQKLLQTQDDLLRTLLSVPSLWKKIRSDAHFYPFLFPAGDRFYVRWAAETFSYLRNVHRVDEFPGLAEEKRTRVEEFLPILLKHNAADMLATLLWEEGEVVLGPHRLRMPSLATFRVLLREIVLDQEYFFPCDTETPRIVDCGAHVGFAVWYWKQLYPKARILAFEPEENMRRIAEENVGRCGFTDVEILPYALDSEEGEKSFLISEVDSMAGSLSTRRKVAGDPIRNATVSCKRLSTYLQEPTHFLKLDIEGVEDRVLEEARNALPNVHYLFVEYHEGYGLGVDRLSRLLGILHNAGFEVYINTSPSFRERMTPRPLEHVPPAYSLSLWGKNTRLTSEQKTVEPAPEES